MVAVSVIAIVASVRRLRRAADTAQAALILLEAELDRRRDIVPDAVRAAAAGDLDREVVNQLVGARTWSAMLREENFDLPARAAAENALSVAVNDLARVARFTPSLTGDWSFHGPARDLDVVEQRIAGAIKVYNRHADSVGRMARGPLGRLAGVAVPELFVDDSALRGVPSAVADRLAA